MAWTEPKTWSSEPLVASDLNTHLRDNLEALKEPPTAHYELNEASNYTTTSASFVDIDATDGKLSLTITTSGGDVLVGFHGLVFPTGDGTRLHMDIDVDDVRIGGDDGIVAIERGPVSTLPTKLHVSFVRLITGLTPGPHTFKLQWKMNSGGNTATLYAGAGTSGLDLHPQFWVREVS